VIRQRTVVPTAGRLLVAMGRAACKAAASRGIVMVALLDMFAAGMLTTDPIIEA
jgi:hypothetical protein